MVTAILYILTQVAQASILNVPADHESIQHALDASQSGDTVLVARGTWYENLVTPNRDLLLCSNYLFSQDSSDITETILDGSLLGTVVTILNEGGNCFTLAGFTIQHGMGSDEGTTSEITAGGVQIEEESCATVLDLVVQNNESPESGSAILSQPLYPVQPVITIKRVKCLTNPISLSEIDEVSQIKLSRFSGIELEDIWIDGQGEAGQGIVVFSNRDLDARRITLKNSERTRFDFAGDPCALSDLTVEQCHAVLIGLQSLADTLRLSNLKVSDCEWGEFWNTGAALVRGWPTLADSILFEGNRMNRGLGMFNQLDMLFIDSMIPGGHVNDLTVRQNVIGDSLPAGAGEEEAYGRFLRPLMLQSIDVKNLKVLDNTVHDEAIRPTQRLNRDGMMVRYLNGRGGVYSLENLEFSGNLVVDHEDFSFLDPDGYSASQGRSIHFNIGGGSVDTVYVRNASFIDERLPNHTPECSTIGGMSVGSVLYVDINQAGLFQAENIVVRDCDDGGIMVDSHADNLIWRNVEIVDVNRRGLCIEDWNAYEGIHEISNVWISGVEEQDMYQIYPYEWCYQQPISIYGSGEQIRVSQVTVVACSTTTFMSSEAVWTNCSYTDNEFDHFFNPAGHSEASWFRYCNMPVEVPGEHLILNTDPVFDTESGPPWLDSSSPLIDAGDPADAFDDVEDPGQPGWALAPSQGTLRSDIGYTGGPFASVLETDWVDVRKPGLPEDLPTTFSLGEPYPNPFNPVTRIPFQLRAPAKVRLRFHSLLGQLVGEKALGVLPSGQHDYMVDGSQWATGVYLVEVLAGEQRDVKKVMLLR